MRHLLFILLCSLTITAHAQQTAWSKMSPLVRQAALQAESSHRRSKGTDRRELCAFVRTTGDGAAVLRHNGCRSLAHWGDIHIAAIPLCHLSALSNHDEILRIEAKERCSLSLDTTAIISRTDKLWQGIPSTGYRQAFRGKGVVMGIEDVGFDLTHPTFFSHDLTSYRIQRFWDMLDTDTIGSPFFVGRDYTSQTDILLKAHATDGLDQTHGTHTAGIAAGSGATGGPTPPFYIGMAPESDLCLVANAVNEDLGFISDDDLYKYTLATDMLGFKYIFDYADSVGKPCVISFSEGTTEDFYGECQLMYEVLDSLVGPGRIIVASAGNQSVKKTYLFKPTYVDASSFIYSSSDKALFNLRSDDVTTLRLTFQTAISQPQSFSYSTAAALLQPDSLLTDTISFSGHDFAICLYTYPNCYDPSQLASELLITDLGGKAVGQSGVEVALTLSGKSAAECFSAGGYFCSSSLNPAFNDAESTHNIHFPSASPSVVCVGNSAWRTGALNYKGEWRSSNAGTCGERAESSSIGPTYQGLIKPDVMAPGMNVISAYSSYYLETHPDARDIKWDVEHFDYGGRTYAWNANSGTSMSSPVVGGIIALWLEANPRLTPSDVLDIIRQTSRRLHGSEPAPFKDNEYGWGEIDAYAGLLCALQMDGIQELEATPATGVCISLQHGTLTVSLRCPSATDTRISVFDVSGRNCLSLTLPAGMPSLCVPVSLPKGVYAVQLNSSDRGILGSVLLRGN